MISCFIHAKPQKNNGKKKETSHIRWYILERSAKKFQTTSMEYRYFICCCCCCCCLKATKSLQTEHRDIFHPNGKNNTRKQHRFSTLPSILYWRFIHFDLLTYVCCCSKFQHSFASEANLWVLNFEIQNGKWAAKCLVQWTCIFEISRPGKCQILIHKPTIDTFSVNCYELKNYISTFDCRKDFPIESILNILTKL